MRRADREYDVIGDRPDRMRYGALHEVDAAGLGGVDTPAIGDRAPSAEDYEHVVARMSVGREARAARKADNISTNYPVAHQAQAASLCAVHRNRSQRV